MALNLKQIFTGDSDQDKLDKVNYNFDQLIVNGGGPQGPLGLAGTQGLQGTQGNQGTMGYQGVQGDQGPQADPGGEYWLLIEGNGPTVDTLIPVDDSGVSNPPSIVIGYKSTQPEYNQSETGAQLVVNRNINSSASNIRLKSAGVISSFDLKMQEDGVLNMSFDNENNNILQQSANVFKFKNTIDDTLLEIDSNEISASVNTTFKENLVIKGDLTIKTNLTPGASGSPDTDKIAVAADNTGLIQFKSKDELGGSVPLGSIISIIPSFFQDDTKFIQEQTSTIAGDDLLKIRVGAGIGEFAGWYICNGKQWNNGSYFETVPDLSSFSYTIDDNVNSQSGQGQAGETNDELHVIGGADIEMSANFNSSSNDYFVENELTDTSNAFVGQGSLSPVLTIKRLPQIIFLGLDDLYWSDAGAGQGQPAINTYNFSDTGTQSGQTHTTTDTAGASSQKTLQLQAPIGHFWSSVIPVNAFTDPNGLTFPNIIQPISIGQDNTKLYITVEQVANGGTYVFSYDSTNYTTANSSTYTLNAQGGSVQPSPIIQTGVDGQSTLIGSVTFTAPNGYKFETAADITAVSNGYSLQSIVVNQSGTISADLYVDSFSTGNFNVMFGLNSHLDLSSTTIFQTGTVEVYEDSPSLDDAEISYKFDTNNYNSTTMSIGVDYKIDPDGFTSSGWIPGPALPQQALDDGNSTNAINGRLKFTIVDFVSAYGLEGDVSTRLYVYEKLDSTNRVYSTTSTTTYAFQRGINGQGSN